jgi:hypothetical protein
MCSITNKPGSKKKKKIFIYGEHGRYIVYLACTSGGQFQVRVATSGLIVKFALMNIVFSNLTTLLQVVTTLTKLRSELKTIFCRY